MTPGEELGARDLADLSQLADPEVRLAGRGRPSEQAGRPPGPVGERGLLVVEDLGGQILGRMAAGRRRLRLYLLDQFYLNACNQYSWFRISSAVTRFSSRNRRRIVSPIGS